MTPDRATAPTLAAAAVIAALAIGSAVFMVASGDIDASALVIAADFGASTTQPQTRSTP